MAQVWSGGCSGSPHLQGKLKLNATWFSCSTFAESIGKLADFGAET
jgi:hypothetical protein